MMIVHQLWRQASRFPGLLAASAGLLVLVMGTYVGQAIAIASAMSAVLGGQAGHIWVALGAIGGHRPGSARALPGADLCGSTPRRAGPHRDPRSGHDACTHFRPPP